MWLRPSRMLANTYGAWFISAPLSLLTCKLQIRKKLRTENKDVALLFVQNMLAGSLMKPSENHREWRQRKHGSGASRVGVGAMKTERQRWRKIRTDLVIFSSSSRVSHVAAWMLLFGFCRSYCGPSERFLARIRMSVEFHPGRAVGARQRASSAVFSFPLFLCHYECDGKEFCCSSCWLFVAFAPFRSVLFWMTLAQVELFVLRMMTLSVPKTTSSSYLSGLFFSSVRYYLWRIRPPPTSLVPCWALRDQCYRCRG